MLLYKILRPILYLIFKIVYKPIIINKENIPKEGRCLLTGNHTSNLDFLSLGSATKRPIR